MQPSDTAPKAKLSQLFPFLKQHRVTLIVIVLIGILGAALSLAQPLVIYQIIDAVQAGPVPQEWIWILLALVLVSALVTTVEHYLLQRTGEGIVLTTRRALITKILRLQISQFDQRRSGDLVSRVSSDTTLLRAVLTQGTVEALGGAVTFFGSIIAMLILDAVLLGLTLAVVFVALLAVVLLSRRIRKASQEAQQRVGDLSANVERAVSGIRTIRASNATAREQSVIVQSAQKAWQAGINIAKASALVIPIGGVALQISFLVVLGVGGFRVANGETSIASLVTFLMFLFMMIMPLGQLFGAVSSINLALGALGRIQEILDLPSEDDSDTDAIQESAHVIQESTDVTQESAHTTLHHEKHSPSAIQFQKVNFQYSGGTDPSPMVLKDVSFTAPAGKRTALVGPSGAGKSTIFALIERFYSPTSGQIFLHNTPTDQISRMALRAQIGYVEQDAPVLAGTLRDNLLLASPHSTDEDCEAVLDQVNLLDILNRDPLGLDAQIGERGVKLSGGERQRLALARVLLAAPPILLLDESTSSLDGQNEQRLQEAIDTVSKNRTLLVIAHRLSTVIESDQIVVLEQGRVTGIGTHHELVSENVLYRDLAKHQLLTPEE